MEQSRVAATHRGMELALAGGTEMKVRRGLQGVTTIWLAVVLAALGTADRAQGQRKPKRAHRETNASRQARIERTLHATYSYPWEVFGGGGYLRWTSGPFTKKNNEVSWAAQADRYISPKLAIVGAAQGSFGYAHQQLPLQFPQIARPQINEYFFTGGLNYRFYEREKVALSAQGTGGVAWGIFSKGAKGLTGPEVGLWQDGFQPAFTFSVNADYNFFPNLAVRVSPTYVGSTFGGQVQNNIGFNAGIIYRFGRQK